MARCKNPQWNEDSFEIQNKTKKIPSHNPNRVLRKIAK